MRKLLPGLLAVALLVCVIPGAQAQQDSFFAGASSFDGSNNLNVDGNQYFNTDSGWFRNDGIHNAGNTNYITGYCGPNDCGGFYYHGYFSFDLGRLTGADTASFNVYSYLIQFDPGTYSIYGTSLSPSQVDSSLDYSDVTLYSALVSGPMIGSIFVTPSDSYSTVTVDLNAAGIAWLNAHAGEGAVIGADFNGTSPVPEPGSLALLGTGLVGVMGLVRRKLL